MSQAQPIEEDPEKKAQNTQMSQYVGIETNSWNGEWDLN